MANVPSYASSRVEVPERETTGFANTPSFAEAKPKVLARRSQLEIRMDMLRVIKEGAEKPTQIMYKANLSWVALQTHLTQLIQRGLLKWASDGTRKRYELTLKGSNVMYSYVKILEEVGEEIDAFYTPAF